MPRKKLGELLLEAGAVDEAGLQAGLEEQKRWGGLLGQTLVGLRLVTEKALIDAVGRQLGLPVVELDGRDIPDDVLELVPGELCSQFGILPFARGPAHLDLAISDPANRAVLDELRQRTHLTLRLHLTGASQLERALARCYHALHAAHAARAEPAPAADAGRVPRVTVPLPPGARPDDDDDDDDDDRDPADAAIAAPILADHARQLEALAERVQALEGLVARDGEMLRKLLALVADKGVATRREVLEILGTGSRTLGPGRRS